MGVLAAARLLELDKDTVNRVVLRAGEHCARVLSELLSSLALTEAQIDELWAFVKKKKVLAAGEDIESECKRTWIWTAIDAPGRLLIAYWIGGRQLDDARGMLEDLADRFDGKPPFVSDELPHYATVLAEIFHRLVPPSPTGRPGRPRGPERVLHPDLDYATAHKTQQGGRVIKVERKVVYGSEASVRERLENSPSQTINTAYIERSNLDWRL